MSIFTIIPTGFGKVLYWLYELVGSYGVALILFTIFAKLIMLPFQMKSKKGMMDMQRIQPKLKELEKKYKDDKQKYSVAVQKLYKDEGVSMFGGCLPLLITLPIMLGLYAVVRQPLTYMLGYKAEQILKIAEHVNVPVTNGVTANVEILIASKMGQFADTLSQMFDNIKTINFTFLGINLAATPKFGLINVLWLIPILSGITAFGVSWVTRRYQPAAANNSQAGATSGMMMYMMPLMSVYIAFVVPAGLGFYWIVNNILMLIQEPLLQWYYTRKKPGTADNTGGK